MGYPILVPIRIPEEIVSGPRESWWYKDDTLVRLEGKADRGKGVGRERASTARATMVTVWTEGSL